MMVGPPNVVGPGKTSPFFPFQQTCSRGLMFKAGEVREIKARKKKESKGKGEKERKGKERKKRKKRGLSPTLTVQFI